MQHLYIPTCVLQTIKTRNEHCLNNVAMAKVAHVAVHASAEAWHNAALSKAETTDYFAKLVQLVCKADV